ncbi:unnamed protein product [Caenorhabditis nigoni]
MSAAFLSAAVFQSYFAFFNIAAASTDLIYFLQGFSFDILNVGSPIVMILISGQLRYHVIPVKRLAPKGSTVVSVSSIVEETIDDNPGLPSLATQEDVRMVLSAPEQLNIKAKAIQTKAISPNANGVYLLSTIRRRLAFVSTVRSPICRSECKGAHLKKWKIGWLHRAERTLWSHMSQIPTGQGKLPKFHPKSE